MDLTQIRYFLALAQTLNFTRAAERCNVTQPALTRSIQRLEDELGGPLLLRERNLTQLTELGRTMLPLLERTFAAAEAVRSEAASLRRRDSFPLRIGLCSLVPAAVLGPVLKELAARFPALELTLAHGTAPRLSEMLLQGELDSALLPEQEVEADRLNRWPLFQDELVVLAAPDHAFAGLETVPLEALCRETVLVGTDQDCALRRAVERLCQQNDWELRIRHRASTGESIVQMVAAGLGVAVVPTRHPESPGVIRRALQAEPAEAQHHPIVLASVAGRPAGRAADAFLRLARARDWSIPERSAA